MTGSIIGIDIGSQGAIALLTPAGELLEVVDMPILRDGPNGRPNVNAALLADIVLKMQAAVAFVEFVGARPGEGPAGAFAFGRSRGVIEGVCGAAGVPCRFLTPAHWKRLVGIAPGKEGAKDAARSEAIRRWPGHAATFARVKDDGARRGGTDRDRGAHAERRCAMTERNDRLLATVRKNAREEIRVTRGDFKGHDIVGLRVWFEDRASGEMRPGKDGLAFRAELVDEIIEALRAAKDGTP